MTCDVFGLGAILCEILTGKPAFVGASTMDVVMQAVGEKLDSAYERLDTCGADADLIDIAKRCLAADKNARPRQAGEVAEAIERHQTQVQERLRKAELERVEAGIQAEEERKRHEVEEAKEREQHRRRLLSLAVAALILLLLVGAAGAGVWYVNDRSHRQTEEQLRAEKRTAEKKLQSQILSEKVTQALNEAEEGRSKLQRKLSQPDSAWRHLNDLPQWQIALGKAQAAWQRAREIADGDPELIDAGVKKRLDALGKLLDADEKDRHLAFELDSVRMGTSGSAGGRWDPTRASSRYARAFLKAGLDIKKGDAAAIAASLRRSNIRFAMVAALDHWAETVTYIGSKDEALYPQLLEIARRADPEPWRDRFRRPEMRFDLPKLKQLAKEVDFQAQSPQMLMSLARKLYTLNSDPAPLVKAALLHYPDEFWLHFGLGNFLMTKNPEASAGHFRVALSIRPENSPTCLNLGLALDATGQSKEAEAYLRKAIAIEPGFDNAYFSLSQILHKRRDIAGAVKNLKKTLECNPNNMPASIALGGVLAEQGKTVEAEKHFRNILTRNPRNAEAHNSLGRLHGLKGALNKAKGFFEKALNLKPGCAEAHSNLGDVLRQLGDIKSAVFQLNKALELNPQLADAHYVLGYIEHSKGNNAAAIQRFNTTIALDPNHAQVHYNYAILLGSQGDRNGAIAHYRSTIRKDPNHPEAHCNLAHLLRQSGGFEEAHRLMRRGHDSYSLFSLFAPVQMMAHFFFTADCK